MGHWNPLPLRFPLAAGLALCLIPAALTGQDPTRTLTGTVVDRQHEPLRGAVVQLQNQAGAGTVISYITGADGAYTFKRLDPGTDYKFWAAYRGHKSRSKTLSHFDMKPNKVVTLVIKLQ